jgi:hypothetical protein
MLPTDELLDQERSGSFLARTLRLGLWGLAATLHKAREIASADDPGLKACDAFLEQLFRRLETGVPSSVSETAKEVNPEARVFDPPAPAIPGEEVSVCEFDSATPLHRPVVETAPTLLPHPATGSSVSSDSLEQPGFLRSLRDAMLSSEVLRQHLGNFRLAESSEADSWQEMQRLLLRLPASLARTWRQKTEEMARQAGSRVESVESSALRIPGLRDELVYSGLCGPVSAPGLWSSTTEPCEVRLGPGPWPNDLDSLARIVTACLRLLELEPHLHHALLDIDRFNVCLLDEQSRTLLADELIRRFRRVCDNDFNPVDAFRARLELDEVIHSLVFRPPVERDSWWGKLQRDARQTLDPAAERARRAHADVHWQGLWGNYASIRKLTNADTNLELDSGGRPGEVLACLRVYGKINDETLPGRVLFRSRG